MIHPKINTYWDEKQQEGTVERDGAELGMIAALDNSETYMDGSSVFNEFENSILNPYPLDNIK